ncbi:hypothetical protein [Rhodococcus sp. T7]|uniref:hypothetical protein n=1 Tax=Rhodococcus sp. T7 TaxID=627444 RepID=UPI00135BDB72|nr:hypothetical protein [Rhodococcus sp. T7]KAF0956844.1 hypothetical protein MLGJGCBP_09924 [Rhodococcus sp. T7]KAF0962044.1 hypothetical protein MLGJGCBP_04826 [Rhodococcus sp. T7]
MTGQGVQINWSKITEAAGLYASGTELRQVQTRLKRLGKLAGPIEHATEALRGLSDGKLSEVRIRHDFLYQEKPLVGSDRKMPSRAERPPASRLVSPRGAALKLFLIALYEAQTRTKPGNRPDNTRPIVRRGRFDVGWIDLVASAAESSGAGRTSHRELEKRARQIRETVKKLADDDHLLLTLPNGTKSTGNYEGFLLNHEGGVSPLGTPPPRYTVPVVKDADFFTVPVELFTNGWIYALEDTELVFLLMVARNQPSDPNTAFRITAAERIQHYGVGPHTYDSHKLLAQMGIVEVTDDTHRYPDGRVADYNGNNALPHQLRFTPDGLEKQATEPTVGYLESRVPPSARVPSSSAGTGVEPAAPA